VFLSLLALAVGAFLFWDDARDFLKSDRPHHWMYGLCLVVLGFLSMLWALAKAAEMALKLLGAEVALGVAGQRAAP